MSDMSQGPGWWKASDGKWYSPETHPSYQAPTAVQTLEAPRPGAPASPPPMAPPPQMAAPQHLGPQPAGPAAYGPPPAKKKGHKGCVVAVVIVLVLVLGVVVAAAAGLHWVGSQIDNGNAFGKTECDAVSTADVNSTLGGSFDVIQLGGITNIAAPVLDSRVLPEAKTCWATRETGSNVGGQIVRIARAERPDAAAAFQAEKTKANGLKEDRGKGLSVESQKYFSKDVAGLGDEAFCTTSDFTGQSGVLVRTGTTLVYVSMNGGGDFNPSFDPESAKNGTVKFADDDKNCETAQKLAAKVK